MQVASVPFPSKKQIPPFRQGHGVLAVVAITIDDVGGVLVVDVDVDVCVDGIGVSQ